MSYSNGQINAPIAASDPYMVMGVGTYNGGYDVGYICSNRHKKINMNARYKPVRFPQIEELSYTQLTYISFGIDIKKSEDATNFEKIKETWEYLAPRGGNDEPFRLTDFINYNHNALPIFNTGLRENIYKNEIFYADLYVAENLPNANLTIDDFIYLKNCYFSAYIKNKDRAHSVFITAEEPISGNPDLSRYLEYNISQDGMFQIGDKIEVYLLLSSTKASETDGLPYGNIYSIKNTEDVVVYKEYQILEPIPEYYFTIEVLFTQLTGYNISFGDFKVTMHSPRPNYRGGILDGGYIKVVSSDIQYEFGTLQVDYKFDTINTAKEEDSYTKEYTYDIQVSDLNEKWVDIYFYDKNNKALASTSLRINSIE